MTAPARYFEDFAVGDAFETGRYRISLEESLAFARAYDPQPFHLDEEAAAASFFRRLVCSGWQTAAITMRLMVEGGIMGSNGLIGAGVDELRWTVPVAPGDELHVHGEVVQTTPWPGGKPRGLIRFRNETINQDDVVVMTHFANCLVPRRQT
ncbi:MAG TPA: MaoC family dehydratase [Candidatus Acidoferrales bacterium]|nr:MaoC family dehydratase [Candidatus Acidoferrales bacterium]